MRHSPKHEPNMFTDVESISLTLGLIVIVVNLMVYLWDWL